MNVCFELLDSILLFDILCTYFIYYVIYYLFFLQIHAWLHVLDNL